MTQLRRLTALAVAIGLGILSGATGRARADGERLNFVSCPIVRDTSTVPCWLTEYEGELYYMGIQTDVSADFQPPYLGHQVLVEATVSDAPRICGGLVLEPITISVMPELDASCHTRLPADERYTIDFNPRPPGPSGGRLAFEERYMPGDSAEASAAPALTSAPGDAAVPVGPLPPSPPGEFLLTFDYNRSVVFRHPPRIMEIADHVQQVGASRVTVTGSRGATLLTDGTVLIESPGIAQQRAEQLAHLLEGIGVDVPMNVTWTDEAAPADGIDDWRSRSVRIVVEQ